MSTAAQALLDDVKARREAPVSTTYISPFPDFDRMLQTLSGGDSGGFSFNLDPKLAGDGPDSAEILPNFEPDVTAMPFNGSFMDAFPGLHAPTSPFMAPMVPPGITHPQNPIRGMYDASNARALEKQSTSGVNYTGSFNPFSEPADNSASSARKSSYSPLDEERKTSRFGFARNRQGSTTASSPLHVSSPLSNSDSFYSSNDAPPAASHWPSRQVQQSEYRYGQPTSQMSSQMNSPMMQHAQPTFVQQQQQPQYHSYDAGVVSEAQLRELIQSSRGRATPAATDNGRRPLFA